MIPGVAMHISHRGHNRSDCFLRDEDHRFYLFQLRRYLPRCGCALHAYCLMTNHVHLLLTPATEKSCTLMMKNVGQLYAQYFNRAYRRSGTLWENRFSSCLVQSELYMLACYRYIELNPVRAGMVAQPRDYRWSSYRGNAMGEADALLSPHSEYLALAETAAERRKVYAEQFGSFADRTEEIRIATNGGYVLGDETFRNATEQALGRRVDGVPAGQADTNEPADIQHDLLLP
jgi:putative transposase